MTEPTLPEPTPAPGDPWRTWRERLPPVVGVVGLVVAALSHADVLAVLPPRIVPYAIAFSGTVLAMTRRRRAGGVPPTSDGTNRRDA